jgi:exonuclease III
MLRIVSWNINRQHNAWRKLVNFDVDIALLQEARQPPPELVSLPEIDQPLWYTTSILDMPWRAAIARFSDRVTMRPRRLNTVGAAQANELAVSRMGTLAIADVVVGSTEEVITVASMYSVWETPAKETGSNWIYADASAHRLISDLSALIGRQKGHKIIAAGDLNILHGYGEHGSPYWKTRYDTIFARMAALGLPFVGPQAPDGGEQAHPWPDELPQDSKNVPTFKVQSGATTRQLDFVFASESLRDRLHVRALNSPKEWGPSDHCRILIELEDLG